MKIKSLHSMIVVLLAGIAASTSLLIFSLNQKDPNEHIPLEAYSAATIRTAGTGAEERTIGESPRIKDSNDDTFWVNSGALYYRQNEFGRTVIGDLPAYSRWRIVYNATNPIDTDKGYHPQNIFRLITKGIYTDVSQQFYFMVIKDNISQSPNRNESNGIFAISRYKNGNNLYYAGVRVDGTAVIKKKVNGIYHTLAQVPFFEGDPYDRNIHPSMIPKNQWIGLRADVETISPGTVKIKLFADRNNTGSWKKIIEAKDTDTQEVPAVLGAGHGGIRSDFMDIRIRNHAILTI